MIKKTLVFFLITFICASCAPKIKNFHKYNKENFPRTSFMPTKKDLTGQLPKVVVFNFDENENEVAKQSKLGSSLALYSQNILTQKRLATLVDRKVAKKLEKEILLSQITNENVVYAGPIVANYAISGEISNAGFNKKYSSSSFYLDKNGNLVKVPAKFTYNANVDGNIKIYEIPSMSVIENFKFSGYSSRSENVQVDGGTSLLGLVNIGGTSDKGVKRDDGLVRKAGKSAMNKVSLKLKNAFARKGYILEKRTYKKKNIFKVNLGSKDGIKHGDRFKIIGQFEEVNLITNEVEIEKRILASGRVANIINPKYSWVVIDNKDDIQKVRLGDVVKFKYIGKFSFFGKYK